MPVQVIRTGDAQSWNNVQAQKATEQQEKQRAKEWAGNFVMNYTQAKLDREEKEKAMAWSQSVGLRKEEAEEKWKQINREDELAKLQAGQKDKEDATRAQLLTLYDSAKSPEVALAISKEMQRRGFDAPSEEIALSKFEAQEQDKAQEKFSTLQKGYYDAIGEGRLDKALVFGKEMGRIEEGAFDEQETTRLVHQTNYGKRVNALAKPLSDSIANGNVEQTKALVGEIRRSRNENYLASDPTLDDTLSDYYYALPDDKKREAIETALIQVGKIDLGEGGAWEFDKAETKIVDDIMSDPDLQLGALSTASQKTNNRVEAFIQRNDTLDGYVKLAEEARAVADKRIADARQGKVDLETLKLKYKAEGEAAKREVTEGRLSEKAARSAMYSSIFNDLLTQNPTIGQMPFVALDANEQAAIVSDRVNESMGAQVQEAPQAKSGLSEEDERILDSWIGSLSDKRRSEYEATLETKTGDDRKNYIDSLLVAAKRGDKE